MKNHENVTKTLCFTFQVKLISNEYKKLEEVEVGA